MAHDKNRVDGSLTESTFSFNRLWDSFVEMYGYNQHAKVMNNGGVMVGVGRVVTKGGQGISRDEARRMLKKDIQDCEVDLHAIFDGWRTHPEHIRLAMLHLRFTLGPHGFRLEKQVIESVRNKDYRGAREALIYSAFCREHPRRCTHVSNIMFGTF